MDNNPVKSNRSLVLYFILAALFALLSILASKVESVTYLHGDSLFPSAKITINMKWLFWLSAALSIAFMLPLIRSLLLALHQQGRLPKMFGWFFREEVVSRFVSTIRFLHGLLFSTMGRLALAGLGIFLLTVAVWRSGAIHEMETNSNLLTFADAARGRLTERQAAATVELCSYLRPQSSSNKRDCLKLVTDLNTAGVKVVVLGMDPWVWSREEFLQKGKEEFPPLRELAKTGIVVFAINYRGTLRTVDSTGELKPLARSITMPDREVEETNRLVRLRPAGIENVGGPRMLDISIEILRRYKGYGSDVTWRQEGGEFRFGDYRIPVTKDGWMYSRDRRFGMPSMLYVDSTSWWYIPNRPWTSNPSQKAIKAGLKITDIGIPVQDTGSQLKGKIVLLTDSFDPPGSYLISKSYQSAIENILSGTLLRKWELGHLWISLLFLMIAGLITYRVRHLVAFLILLALLPFVLIIGSYLYTSYDILIDLFYPLLSTAMAIAVFPIVAMGKHYGSGREEF